MKKIMTFAAAFMLVCNSAQAAVVTLTEDDNNGKFEFNVGDIVRINLKGNATTGYSWQFQNSDVAVAGKIAEGYVPDAAPEGMVGTGGTFEYVVKLLQGRCCNQGILLSFMGKVR